MSILNVDVTVRLSLRCHDKVNDYPKLSGCGAMDLPSFFCLARCRLALLFQGRGSVKAAALHRAHARYP
jgi:hypothetical protein